MNTRLRREDPERAEPIRSWEHLFRSEPETDAAASETPSSGARASPPPPDGEHRTPGAGDEARVRSWERIAREAVERGYEVIEEEIREGRRIAEQLGSRAYDAQRTGDDATRLVERTLRFYADVGSLWFELVESVLRNPALAASELFGRQRSGDVDRGGGRRRSEETSNGPGLAIEVSSPRRVRVNVDLKVPASAALAVPALRALDQGKPALTAAGFEERGRGVVLCITVPAEQPADIYSGVIVDTETSEPKGTLSVNVCDAETAD